MISQYILSQEVSAIMAVIGCISDVFVVVLTCYTFFLTVYSKNLKYVSFSTNSTLFFGTTLAITIMKKTLHVLPIQSVFIMKKYRNQFYYIDFVNYSYPIVIESWSTKKIETEPFTCIDNFSFGDNCFSYNNILKDAVIGIKSGQDLIWVEPHENSPLCEAKRAYEKHNYCLLSVFRRRVEETVISESVGCIISVRLKDINGQIILKKLFGITGWNDGKSVFLSESLCGYNGLNGAGNTAESIANYIHETFGINEEDICVRIIDKI